MTKFKSNIRIFECTDGDSGRPQLVSFVSKEIQKEFAGKRVDIKLSLEKKRKGKGGGDEP